MSYQQPTNNPYGANPPAGNDPYAQQPANPYGQPSADPYAQASATPYGQPSADPYAQTNNNAYGQPSAADPYAQTGGSYAAPATGGYGQSAPATGYAQSASDPYAANAGYSDPYAAQTYGQPGVEPYGYAQPGYGMQTAVERPKMGFMQAIKAFFQNYANFNGRANVSEFWPPIVLFGVVNGLLAGLLSGLGVDRYGDITGFGIVLGLLLVICGLAVILPSIALYVRRFHDQNKSGWFYALTLIPYVGGLIVFIMALVGKSDPAGARFDDPSGKQPATGN